MVEKTCKTSPNPRLASSAPLPAWRAHAACLGQTPSRRGPISLAVGPSCLLRDTKASASAWLAAAAVMGKFPLHAISREAPLTTITRALKDM